MFFFFSTFILIILVLTFLLLLWRYPLLGVYGIGIFMVLGEFARVTIPFIAIEILALDGVVLLFSLLWLIRRWWYRGKMTLDAAIISFIIFGIIAFISLLLGIQREGLSLSESLNSGFYLVRLSGYALLYLIVSHEKISIVLVSKLFLSIALCLSVIGFFQLVFFPDFTSMALEGWDPHIGRLLSTWFDPNFLGGFFAFILIVLTNMFFIKTWSRKTKILLISSALLIILALFLTFSRSAYLMLIIGLFLTGLCRSPKILLFGILVFVIMLVVLPRARERLQDMMGSMFAFAFNSYDYTLDETAKLRVESWGQSLDLFSQHPLIGVGYNTLRYVQWNNGMIMDENIHSGAGGDSSFLTILSTAGILGLLAYLSMYGAMLWMGIRNIQQTKDTILSSYAWGMVLGLFALFVQAFFVNSLILPYFLVLQFVGFGVLSSWKTK